MYRMYPLPSEKMSPPAPPPLTQVHVEPERDPSRLLKGTATQMRRLEEKRSEEREGRDSGFILHHGGQRAVPSWAGGGGLR